MSIVVTPDGKGNLHIKCDCGCGQQTTYRPPGATFMSPGGGFVDRGHTFEPTNAGDELFDPGKGADWLSTPQKDPGDGGNI